LNNARYYRLKGKVSVIEAFTTQQKNMPTVYHVTYKAVFLTMSFVAPSNLYKTFRSTHQCSILISCGFL